jgi:hypothetical protein
MIDTNIVNHLAALDPPNSATRWVGRSVGRFGLLLATSLPGGAHTIP